MDEKIFKRLKSDYEYLEALGYEVFGVYLQGSQNYHLNYEDSDIDTKAIILPSFQDVVLNHKPISTTIILETNEHIDVKDIRLMFVNFKKQNINFLEILFTEYTYLNAKYAPWHKVLAANAESIAHYNNHLAVKCIVGMAKEKYKAMEHPYPTLLSKIKKYGYDPKQLHHILRCEEFLKRYINNEPYSDCLIPRNPEYLIKVKRCPPLYTLKEARGLAAEAIHEMEKIEKFYLETNSMNIEEKVDVVLNDVITNCLQIYWGIKK